jgi:predicted permease
VPLLGGRFLEEQDDTNKQMVVITDQSTARRYWPNDNALGKRIRISNFEGKQDSAVVVGIVGDIKQDGLDQDGVPHVYTSIYQSYGKVMSFVVRTSLPASSLEPQIRSAIQAVDPDLPVFGIRSLGEGVYSSLAMRRFSAVLVATFAGVALLLASIGIYGLLAYMVRQRSMEIGVRMALGANRPQIVKLFLANGMLLASTGVLAGLVVSLLVAPLIASLLYHVRPLDPAVFLTVSFVLLAVSLMASFVPALRAARVDPQEALRQR